MEEIVTDIRLGLQAALDPSDADYWRISEPPQPREHYPINRPLPNHSNAKKKAKRWHLFRGHKKKKEAEQESSSPPPPSSSAPATPSAPSAVTTTTTIASAESPSTTTPTTSTITTTVPPRKSSFGFFRKQPAITTATTMSVPTTPWPSTDQSVENSLAVPRRDLDRAVEFELDRTDDVSSIDLGIESRPPSPQHDLFTFGIPPSSRSRRATIIDHANPPVPLHRQDGGSVLPQILRELVLRVLPMSSLQWKLKRAQKKRNKYEEKLEKKEHAIDRYQQAIAHKQAQAKSKKTNFYSMATMKP